MSLRRAFVYVLLISNCNAIQLTYTQSSTALPAWTKGQMGAYCNETGKVWLFGGVTREKVVWSFDPNNHHFEWPTNATYAFRSNLFAAPIKNSTLYWNPAETYTSSIARFFTQSVSFEYHWLWHPKNYTDFRIAITPDSGRNILFLLGGSNTKEAYMMDLDEFIATGTATWHQGTDFNQGMSQPVITNSHMYKLHALGIEYLNISGSINDIASRDWQLVLKDLSGRTNAFALVQNSYTRQPQIWTMGGWKQGVWGLGGVRIYDVENAFNVSTGTTPFESWYSSTPVYIARLDVLYVFGGGSDDFGNRQVRGVYQLEYWPATGAPSVSPTGERTTETDVDTSDIDERGLQIDTPYLIIGGAFGAVILCICCFLCFVCWHAQKEKGDKLFISAAQKSNPAEGNGRVNRNKYAEDVREQSNSGVDKNDIEMHMEGGMQNVRIAEEGAGMFTAEGLEEEAVSDAVDLSGAHAESNE